MLCIAPRGGNRHPRYAKLESCDGVAKAVECRSAAQRTGANARNAARG